MFMVDENFTLMISTLHSKKQKKMLTYVYFAGNMKSEAILLISVKCRACDANRVLVSSQEDT